LYSTQKQISIFRDKTNISNIDFQENMNTFEQGLHAIFLFKHCATEKKYFVNLMMTKKYDALVQTCF